MPELGEKVKIWPAPGRSKVHLNERPIDQMGGGRAVPPEGVEVLWTEFLQEHYTMGDYLLHPPPDEQAAVLPSPTKAASKSRSAAKEE